MLLWTGIGLIGDFIRKYYFDEQSDFSNILLGPVTLIMSGIEALLIKHLKHKAEKTIKEIENVRKEVKPLTIYEKRAIERINKLLEINN